METFHPSLPCTPPHLSLTAHTYTQCSASEGSLKISSQSLCQPHPPNSLLSVSSGIYLTSTIFSGGVGEATAALNTRFWIGVDRIIVPGLSGE